MSGFKTIRLLSFAVALTMVATPLLAQRGGGRGGAAGPDPFPTTIPADDPRITALKQEDSGPLQHRRARLERRLAKRAANGSLL